MGDGDQLDCVIGAVYDAAAEPDRWGDALRLMAAAAGGFGADFMIWSKTANDLEFIAEAGGHSPVAVKRYGAHCGALDQARLAVIARPVGKVLLRHEEIPDDFVRRSEYYTDFFLPMGGRYGAGSTLVDDEGAVALYRVHRSQRQGAFGREAATFLDRLTPHMRRAAHLQRRHGQAERRAADEAALIDHIPWAAFVLDGKARIVSMNRAGQELAAIGDGISILSGRLAVADHRKSGELAELLSLMLLSATGGGRRASGAVTVPRASGLRPYVVAASRLTVRSGVRFGGAEPSVLVLVGDLEVAPHFPAAAVKAVFDLSPSELRVASEIASGRSPDEIAALAGRSRNTVRAQLQAIYAKTGTSRQSELAGLIAKIPRGSSGG
jgi:DNA-binding CsgD family transcriptional regulator